DKGPQCQTENWYKLRADSPEPYTLIREQPTEQEAQDHKRRYEHPDKS
ncbi:hypothetical protein Q6301_27315, partial [Klebsiella quasipneumoniae]